MNLDLFYHGSDSILPTLFSFFFFFNDTATTEIYTLSLHDALPISAADPGPRPANGPPPGPSGGDRKSTRLNSSHGSISYAVFCLKKKKEEYGELFVRKQKTKESCGRHINLAG